MSWMTLVIIGGSKVIERVEQGPQEETAHVINDKAWVF